MKLKQLIKYILHRFYFFIKAPHALEITPRGLYYCHYCINKYINNHSIPPQEQYDSILEKKKNKLESIHFFDKIGALDESKKYCMTAFMHISTILCCINKKGRKKVYKYFDNTDDLNFLKKLIKKKIMI